MNILIITNGFPPTIGGSYRLIYEICKRLPYKSIHVLTSAVEGTELFDSKEKFKIIRSSIYSFLEIETGIIKFKNLIIKTSSSFLGKAYNTSPIIRRLFIIFYFLKAIIEVKKLNIDFIISGHSAPPTGIVAWLIKVFYGIDYISYVYGEEISEIFTSGRIDSKIQLKLNLKRAVKLIVNSLNMKQKLIESGIERKKIELVYPGIGYENVDSNLDGSLIKKKYGLDQKKIMLSVGRLIERKGFDMVIKALPRIIKEVPNIKYLIRGSGPDKNRLLSLIKYFDVNEHVLFIENQDYSNLFSFYASCDLFVMPNRTLKNGDEEGFGIVFLEANLCGKPVIGGRSGGATDAIINGKTGFLVNPEDLNEITEMIILLIKDKELADSLGKHGRERAISQFSWDLKARQISSILSNLIIRN